MNEEKVKISNEEYAALRNEIVSTLEQQRNVWLTMYTIYVALFVIAIEYSYRLLPISFIILIPFQCVINSQNWTIQKTSTYIRCFLENEKEGFHWEGLHMYPEYKNYHKKYGNSKLINYTGATQLAVLTYIVFVALLITNNIKMVSDIPILDIFLLFLTTVLSIVTFIINRKFKKENACELEKVMVLYKKSLSKK